ncbi:hypothetical protein, partial [Staphylococcus aureus]
FNTIIKNWPKLKLLGAFENKAIRWEFKHGDGWRDITTAIHPERIENWLQDNVRNGKLIGPANASDMISIRSFSEESQPTNYPNAPSPCAAAMPPNHKRLLLL